MTITARELTPREQEVVDLVVSGMACKDIASTLEISPKTVNVHLKSSFIKLGVHSRVELVGKALRGQIADLKSQLTEAKGRR